VILRAGTYPNVIPEASELSYHIRAVTLADLEELVGRVEGCFRAAALATGCSLNFEWGIRYKNLVHNVALTEVYRKHGLALGVEYLDADMKEVVPTGAATDAGNVSHCIPTLHTVYLAKVLAHTAIELFCDPILVQKVKDEYADWRSSTTMSPALPQAKN
ncbi:hypothetical protein MRX96_044548, partial [Rhipicephalus microplus]